MCGILIVIYWIEFYAVSAIFQSCNGGIDKEEHIDREEDNVFSL